MQDALGKKIHIAIMLLTVKLHKERNYKNLMMLYQ